MSRFAKDQVLSTSSALRVHGINDNEGFGLGDCLGRTRPIDD